MLVGRDSETAQLDKVLHEGKHALVVISSRPGMGRSALLKEFRVLAENINWRVLPAVSKGEKTPEAFSISRDTTECEFLDKGFFTLPLDIKTSDSRIRTTSLYQGSAVPESAKDDTDRNVGSVVSVQSADTVFQPLDNTQVKVQERADMLQPSVPPRPTAEVDQAFHGTLILIDNYQPSEAFEDRLLQHCIPETRRAASPVVIVVAGYSGDLAALAESADRRIDLGPLPIQATTKYFSSLNDDIEMQMPKEEIQAYAAASAKDPSLVDAFTRVLRLK